LRLFYASDVHGSDLCWRKFINAAEHYGAGALVMGGDLTGKGLVPIIRDDGHYRARVIGEDRTARTPDELAQLERAIRMNGMYPYVISEAEHLELRQDSSKVDAAFERLIKEELCRWVELADGRLHGKGVSAYVMAGNDDPFFVDDIIARGVAVVPCDGRVVTVGEHEMLSLGYSNPTPWKTPREVSEDELYRRLRPLAELLDRPASAIFNLHVPPRASGLDTAYEVDDSLNLVLKGGQPNEVPIGSSAVRQIIEEFQPALSLHGHVHESKGVTHIGRTVVVNPGSDYSSGRLEGCVVEMSGERIVSSHLVRG
jgi:uncharacterized protein